MAETKEKETEKKRIKIGYGEERKKLIRKQVEIVIKSRVPVNIEKLLSWIEYDVGINRDTARSILIMLHDIDVITIDEEKGMVYWGNPTQIPQGNSEKEGSKT